MPSGTTSNFGGTFAEPFVDILAIEAVPGTARGQCPLGGPGYAAAVFRYARALALAAKADGAWRKTKDEAEYAHALDLAQAELALLQVNN